MNKCIGLWSVVTRLGSVRTIGWTEDGWTRFPRRQRRKICPGTGFIRARAQHGLTGPGIMMAYQISLCSRDLPAQASFEDTLEMINNIGGLHPPSPNLSPCRTGGLLAAPPPQIPHLPVWVGWPELPTATANSDPRCSESYCRSTAPVGVRDCQDCILAILCLAPAGY